MTSANREYQQHANPAVPPTFSYQLHQPSMNPRLQAPKHTPAGVWKNEHGDGDGCERLKEYGDGGLCPIIIDDELSGEDIYDQKKYQFRIIGKLGYGAYATVWLARNMY